MAERGSYTTESDILGLAHEAVKDGLIRPEVLDRLASLRPPQVPISMKFRYLVACFRTELRRLKKTNKPVNKFDKYANVIVSLHHCYLDDVEYCFEDLSELADLLVPYPYKWWFLGMALKFQPEYLDELQISSLLALNAPKSYLIRLLEDWLLKTFSHSLPPTKHNLKRVLESPHIGLGSLSRKLNNIESKHASSNSITVSLLSSDKESLAVQKRNIAIKENASTLLEVLVTSGGDNECTYEWFQDGKALPPHLDIYESFLYLHRAGFELDGSEFACKVRWERGFVVEVTLNVSCSLDRFRESLASIYLAWPEVLEDTWPPVSSKKFINLALIKQSEIA